MMPYAVAAALAVALLLWASAFAGIRAGLAGYGPFHLALLRFLVASVALLAYALVARIRPPRAADLPRIGVLGFFGITVYHLALNYGETTVSAGSASLLIASGPIFTAVLAVIFLGERLSAWGWVGITLGFAGVALIAWGEGEGLRFDPGAFWIVVAAFSTSLYFVFQKPLHRRYTPLEVTAYTLWAGTLWMLPFWPGLPAAVAGAPAAATWSVIYLGLGPAALAYVLWTYALSRLPASRVTSFLYLSPALAIVIAWLWLGEWPSALSLVGGGIAVLGVLVTNLWGRAPAPAGIS
ncbi:DMT family transporter [Oceanithermus sp.]|uniref:DMT family transporter n=2 Tax=Oceanithermus sp. TaxID=2268145 RepID=UPI0025E9CC92|nr:DMT family transporter [Oceanithermus sp.]